MPQKFHQSIRSNKENDNTFGSPKKDLKEETSRNLFDEVKIQLAKE
jgi:hypothetical protein